MEIVRYADRQDRSVHVGVRQDGAVTPLAVADLATLWGRPGDDLPAALADTAGPARPLADVLLLPPIDGPTEVWAAGVTYARSRSAREEESAVSSVYEMVYDADRPELFFKAAAWRVVTDGEPVGIRLDSGLDVPEAELALVLNAEGRIVGYTACNDMSSRSIEGENPLYLPQAKVYAGSCALAAGIRPASEIADAADLAIELRVVRDGHAVWEGATSTAAMHRTFDELARWLFAEQSFPAGVVLATGTGLVPEMGFSLRLGDIVRIRIDQVGTLTNVVRAGRDSFTWLASAISDPLARHAGRPGDAQGGGGVQDRLPDGFAREERRMTDHSVTHATFTLERTYPVPPDRVFSAWADPEVKRRWFAGADSDHRLDFRVGGQEVNQARHNDAELTFESVYRDIVTDKRIVYTSVLSQGDRPTTVSLTTVELHAVDDSTVLVLTEQGAFLDGLEQPAWREQGTGEWLDALGVELGTNFT